MEPYVYRAQVTRVLDGDSIEADIDLGFRLRWREIVRIAGVNAPEISSPQGQVVRRELQNLLDAYKGRVVLRSHKQEKYRRVLAEVEIPPADPPEHLPGVKDLAAWLIERGHAVPWNGKGARP